MINYDLKRVEELYKDEKLGKLANDHAKEGKPNSEKHWNDIKERIILRLLPEGHKELDEIEGKISDISNRVDTMEKNMSDVTKYEPDVNDVNNVKGKIEERENALKDFDNAIVEYSEFKEEHNIEESKNPWCKEDPRTKQVVVLAGLVLFEAILNSVLWADGVRTGVFQGFVIAFIISLINVASGFLGGYLGWRHLINHPNVVNWQLGLPVALASFVICLLTITSAAAFLGNSSELQELLDKSIREQVTDAWKLAQDSLGSLDISRIASSPEAAILLLFGLLCAFVATLDGYYFGHPYLDFGRSYWARNKAEQKYRQIKKDCDDCVSNYNKEYSKRYKDLQKSYNEMNTFIGGLKKQIKGNENIEKHLIGMAKYMLTKYRTDNENTRRKLSKEFQDVPAEVVNHFVTTQLSTSFAYQPMLNGH